MSSKHRSRRSVWGDWSDWVWSAEQNTYYRARQDTDGNWDYDYHPGAEVAAPEVTDHHVLTTPRDQDPIIDGLTHGIENLTTAPFDPSGAYAYDQDASAVPTEYAEYSYSHPTSNKSRRDTGRHHHDRGKGKAVFYPKDEDEARATQQQTGASDSTGFDPDATDDLDDPSLQDTINMSKNWNRGPGSGEPSNSQGGAVYGAYEPFDDEGPPTPKGSYDIQGTMGDAESLDPRYTIEPSKRFQPGEIFKVLWSEPSGNIGGTPTISDKWETRDQYGGLIYVGFRRFIVIANDEGHCSCVPILTYGGKACKKRGVKAHKHGIIYTQGHRVKPLENEPKLGFPPTRMRIEAEGEKLSKESRVNYSKLVTIEHNVKVFFIGHIIPEDWDLVSEAVNKCWEDKIHHSRRKRYK